MIVSSALMIWKGLMVVTGSESPIVVVLSGSMEPAFQVTLELRFKPFSLQRGDLLFLTNYEEEDIRVGEIVVFKIDGRDIPIVHRFDPILADQQIPLLSSLCRVLKLHEKEDGSIKFLTKVKSNTALDSVDQPYYRLPHVSFNLYLFAPFFNHSGRQQQCGRQRSICSWATLVGQKG